MKFEEMYIAFNGENEKNMLCMILESIGYKALDQLNVGQRYFSTDRVGNFWTTNICIFPDMIVCFGGFVNKYKIHSKAYRAMTDFNLNKNQLSLKLGFSRQYIGRVLSKPQSEKVQKNVIEKIDELYSEKINLEIDAFNQKSLNKRNKDVKILTFAVWVLIVVIFALIGFMEFA